MSLIIAATGHRPNKLGGYTAEVSQRLMKLAFDYLQAMQPTGVISGMALGWDLAFAEAAQVLRIPLHAAVPFNGQEWIWPAQSQIQWKRLIAYASSVTIVSPGGYSAEKMQIRNQWMVDRCDRLCALWDGSAGGTSNCIKYAANDPLVQIDNLWFTWKQQS